MRRNHGGWRNYLTLLGGVLLSCALALEAGQASGQSADEQQPPSGRELFVRQWIPNDSRGGGDGLGPMFNDSSCVACHNQGGVGGSGPRAKNAQLLTVITLDGGSLVGAKRRSNTKTAKATLDRQRK